MIEDERANLLKSAASALEPETGDGKTTTAYGEPGSAIHGRSTARTGGLGRFDKLASANMPLIARGRLVGIAEALGVPTCSFGHSAEVQANDPEPHRPEIVAASREARTLVDAFSRIESAELRADVLGLIVSLAKR